MISQADLRQAILDPSKPVPKGLNDGRSGPAGRRFSVYRNNVVVSLKEAMASAFPLVQKLIGAENFSNICGLFVRQHPPKSPLMMYYGEEFPDFVRDFEPLRKWGYLADCAALDLAMRKSYHAADSIPVPHDLFARETALTEARFRLAPSSLILCSRWPLYDIWRYNMVPGSAKPRAEGQDILIARSGFDAVPHLMPVGASQWISHLDAGNCITDATEQTLKKVPDFDLAQVLTLVLQTNSLVKEH